MIIWLTGIPGVGKRPLAEALKKALKNGRRIQILDAAQVRYWTHPFAAPPEEQQVAMVAWVAHLLASNDIVTVVCCVSPSRDQRNAIRHKSYEGGVPFHEVWVDGDTIGEDLERRLGYEHPDPPDARATVKGNDGWDELARQVLSELDL
jgi:adenylylsulfate kinase-like enzyme